MALRAVSWAAPLGSRRGELERHWSLSLFTRLTAVLPSALNRQEKSGHQEAAQLASYFPFFYFLFSLLGRWWPAARSRSSSFSAH
jgi:hypothetical protein